MAFAAPFEAVRQGFRLDQNWRAFDQWLVLCIVRLAKETFEEIAAQTLCLRFLGTFSMISYVYKNPQILFVGINPHFGSFDRGVPFSNNKLFWYLLSEAGIIEEKRDLLRNDEELKRVYTGKFNDVYGLGLVNIIGRPTQDVSKLIKGEELPGRKKISRIINGERPKVACFIGKVTYEKYTGSKNFTFGWQDNIGESKVFVMHFPLRGEAIVRVRELREVALAAGKATRQTLDRKVGEVKKTTKHDARKI